MPKIVPLEPLKESATIYDAFLEEHSKAEEPAPKPKARPQQQPSGQASQHKKKKDEKKKASGNEDLLGQLKADEIDNVLASTRHRFPSNPIVWLKDLAAYLNGVLENQPLRPGSSVLSGHPLSGLNVEVQEALLRSFEECGNEAILSLFFEHCLQNLLQGITKGQPVWGYRLCLQLLACQYPHLVVDALPKLRELRTSYQNRQPACQALLWAAAQAGLQSLPLGLSVWLELVLPVLGVRAFTAYVLDILEALLSRHPEGSPGVSEVLGIRQVFPLLDLAYGDQGASLARPQLQRLRTLYTRLKALSYGDTRKRTLRHFFPSYLRRLVPSATPDMRRELLGSLIECLAVDPQCVVVWKQLYPKHLAQSRLLLEHLCETWEALPPASRKLLVDTLPALTLHNSNAQEHVAASAACMALQKKMRRKRSVVSSIFWLLFTLALMAASAALAYDVFVLHGGIVERSHTARFLKDAGAPELWEKTRVHVEQGYRWAEANVPVYYSRVAAVLGPHLANIQELVLQYATIAWNKLEPVRDWLCINVPPLLQWANDRVPVFLEEVLKVLHSLWAVVGAALVTCFNYMQVGVQVAHKWLLENLLTGSWSPEKLSARAAEAADILQGYAGAAFRWLAQQTAPLMGASPH
uniref:Uncharacterized protein n=1 Tax=Ornithodoros turicata TaxID=34597 RepID=A0A2R5LKA9_9ACAR